MINKAFTSDIHKQVSARLNLLDYADSSLPFLSLDSYSVHEIKGESFVCMAVGAGIRCTAVARVSCHDAVLENGGATVIIYAAAITRGRIRRHGAVIQ